MPARRRAKGEPVAKTPFVGDVAPARSRLLGLFDARTERQDGRREEVNRPHTCLFMRAVRVRSLAAMRPTDFAQEVRAGCFAVATGSIGLNVCGEGYRASAAP